MKLHLLDRSTNSGSSFSVTEHKRPYFLKVWHYHPELELVLIEKSNGTRFIGDSIEPFMAGEVILLGKNLPHMWLNNNSFFNENSEGAAKAVAIHFKEDFLGEIFFKTPEFNHINTLLKKASRGIKFNNISSKIIEDFKALLSLKKDTKAIAFIQLLSALATQKNYELLSSEGFINNFMGVQNNRLYHAYKFVFNNFKKEINASSVAFAIGMNASAFSRFFKKTHGETFTRYLNQIRIGYACKLLLENDNKITSIAFEAGFNNISNFNRQFKVIKKMSPSQYVEFHTKKSL